MCWGVNLWIWVESKNFWNFNVWIFVLLGNNYDYFEFCEEGCVWVKFGSVDGGFWVGSDSCKWVCIMLNGGYWLVFEKDWYDYWFNVGMCF